MGYYTGKKALVTGGTGFLGSHVVEALLAEGASVRVASRPPEANPFPGDAEAVASNLYDLQECRKAARGMDYIFHLAAFGWGLGANVQAQPALFTNNVLLNTTMLEAAYQEGVKRYLLTSSSAVYDGSFTVLDDTLSWGGDPHPSEFCFGWAKRAAELQARAYVQHYGMEIAVVRPSNPYGTRDNVDPERSHVIPALIRRAVSREHPLVIWGTGRAVRSFVYAGDVAQAMLLALERCATGDPLNVASQERTSIADLTRLVLNLCNYHDAQLQFDTSKPEGHPGKFPTIAKAQEKIGFKADTSLREGLEKTIAWFTETQMAGQRR